MSFLKYYWKNSNRLLIFFAANLVLFPFLTTVTFASKVLWAILLAFVFVLDLILTIRGYRNDKRYF